MGQMIHRGPLPFLRHLDQLAEQGGELLQFHLVAIDGNLVAPHGDAGVKSLLQLMQEAIGLPNHRRHRRFGGHGYEDLRGIGHESMVSQG